MFSIRSTEESLKFSAQYNVNHFILKSTKAYSCDQKKTITVGDEDDTLRNLTRNLIALNQAQEKAEEDIPLQRLYLHEDTPYIQKLWQALEKNLPSQQK